LSQVQSLQKKAKIFSHGKETVTEKAFHFRGNSTFVGDKYFLVPALALLRALAGQARPGYEVKIEYSLQIPAPKVKSGLKKRNASLIGGKT
jgi:hypothetical protein